MEADSPLEFRPLLGQAWGHARGGGMALLLLSAPLLLAGCAAVPDTGPRPIARTADSIAASQSLPSGDQGQWPADSWWTAYGDPQLDSLIAEGLAHSPDVAAATARLRKADAMARQAGAALLPTLDGHGAAGLTKQSYNQGFPAPFVAYLPHGWKGEGQLDLTLGFDPDLWGRNRAALAAATSERQAAAVDSQQAALMLATSIAQAYADLGAALALRYNRAATLDSRTATQSLTDQRMREGMETRGSLRTAQAQADSARADLLAADQTVLLRRHQLAALLGAGPDRGLTIAAPHLAPMGVHELPAGVTTELMARRADIVAARTRVEAAASRIKVARADFYPALKINGLVGVESLGFGQLFTGGSIYGTVGPAVSLPLFHGGALRAAYRGARADYDLAVADYDRIVLTAYQQVADAVTDRSLLAGQLTEARAAVSASEEANAIADARYRGGLSNYLDALIVQDRLVQTREALVMTDAAFRSADIALIRALGGGFAETTPSTALQMRQNTLQTPQNTLQTPPNTLQTPKDYPHE
jgi:NodT family efflux transporter outer membrane factor (OMF) lipoprotein